MGATPTVYVIPLDVEKFLLSQVSFDANSDPSAGSIQRYILKAEGEFEERTGRAFKPRLVTEELHDAEAWRPRHRELFNEHWATHRVVPLNHRPIIPFDTNRGHKIEVFEGASGAISATAPEGAWTDFVATKTHGRASDWWCDLAAGKVYVKKLLIRTANLFRFTYEYGKPITTTSGSLTSTGATVTVASTYGYENRGMIRIDNEYIFHTGKTTTTFTGCQRAQLDSNAQAHDSGSEVYEVPDNVRELITMRAAALYLDNEVFVAAAGDGAGTAPGFADKVARWNATFDREISTTYQRFELL